MSTKTKLLGLPKKKKKKVVIDELDRGSFHRVVGTEGKFLWAQSQWIWRNEGKEHTVDFQEVMFLELFFFFPSQKTIVSPGKPLCFPIY